MKVKQLMVDDISVYERRLEKEIALLDKQIAELTKEKEALQRQLRKERITNSPFKDVNRKNSISRIMVENRIIEILAYLQKPMSVRKLYEETKHVNFELKENTFRTYLHRLKEKDIIERGKNTGEWKIKNPVIKNPVSLNSADNPKN